MKCNKGVQQNGVKCGCSQREFETVSDYEGCLPYEDMFDNRCAKCGEENDTRNFLCYECDDNKECYFCHAEIDNDNRACSDCAEYETNPDNWL